MYKEIHILFFYCLKHGIKAELKSLFDGYKICFPNGGDIIQHRYSYGACNGCVEPAIGSRMDYEAVPLNVAKRLVYSHREKLNRRIGDGQQG